MTFSRLPHTTFNRINCFNCHGVNCMTCHRRQFGPGPIDPTPFQHYDTCHSCGSKYPAGCTHICIPDPWIQNPRIGPSYELPRPDVVFTGSIISMH